jgi:peptide/nickel transport system substrate-binding protein
MLSRNRGRASLVLATLAVLAFALPAGAQTRGGSATIGVEQDIAGFDPLIVGVYDTGQEATAVLLFETLTRLDDNGKAAPGLAQSWEHSADFKTWTFKLRPGVKFHDGSPFNAAAVAFNYQRMLDPANHCRCLFYISGYDRVEAADENTVVFHLKYPSPNLPAIVAPAAVTNVIHSPKAITEMKEGYNRHPVGTGPFRLKSWESGNRIVLERNPDYWDAGKPYLD